MAAEHKKRRGAVIIISAVALILIIALLINIFYCENSVVTAFYSISSEKLKTDLRIALVSDLHMKDYGDNNKKVIDAVKENNPDIIAAAGDLTNTYSQETDTAVNLLEQLCRIAPTYYATGNHELHLLENEEFLDKVAKTGTHFLCNKSEYFEKDGEEILIGGIKQYPFFEYDYPDFDNDERYFLDDFLKKEADNYGILICHYPECFMWTFSELDIDLMLSGHTHGGLIKLPFIGGVFAPSQGLFPKYDYGVFKSDSATMVITSGLSNSNFLPRVNNPGEVCIININKDV